MIEGFYSKPSGKIWFGVRFNSGNVWETKRYSWVEERNPTYNITV